MESSNMPCGNCDIGIYCERASMNKIARKFGALEPEERLERMPRCKVNKDKQCEGANDFHEAIKQLDEIMELERKVI